jgi:DNA-binding NtrC family response regulator
MSAASRSRVLVCGDPELHETISGMASAVDLRLVDSYAALIEALGGGTIDVAIVASDGRDAPQVLRQARATCPRTRLLIVAEPKDRAAVRVLLEGVVDGLLERPVDREELLHSLMGVGAVLGAPAVPRSPVILVASTQRDDPSLPEVLAQAGLEPHVVDDADGALDVLERSSGSPLVVLDLESASVDWLPFLVQLGSRTRADLLAVVPTAAEPHIGFPGLFRGTDCAARPLRSEDFARRARRLYDRVVERDERDPREVAAPSVWVASRNPLMRRTLGLIESIAPTEATVCLRGEMGIGKEMLARLMHDWSARSTSPFLGVNCGALYETLLDAEVFGQDRDPVTGAVRLRRGLVELAAGGTLFLDEIDALSVGMQSKVLRLLEDREFVRIGGVEVLHSDVRIIAATSQSLESLVQQGRFDRNLYRWVMQVPLPVPPLRERSDDVPELATFLLRRIAKAHGRPIPRFAPAVLPKLLRHAWPGNVCELEIALEQALLRSPGTEIRDVELGVAPAAWRSQSDPDATIVDAPAAADKLALMMLLFKARGNAKVAAATAGLDRRSLYRKIHAFHNDPLGFDTTFD